MSGSDSTEATAGDAAKVGTDANVESEVGLPASNKRPVTAGRRADKPKAKAEVAKKAPVKQQPAAKAAPRKPAVKPAPSKPAGKGPRIPGQRAAKPAPPKQLTVQEALAKAREDAMAAALAEQERKAKEEEERKQREKEEKERLRQEEEERKAREEEERKKKEEEDKAAAEARAEEEKLKNMTSRERRQYEAAKRKAEYAKVKAEEKEREEAAALAVHKEYGEKMAQQGKLAAQAAAMGTSAQQADDSNDAIAIATTARVEGCSCKFGNPCQDKYICKDWNNRFAVAKKNGWKEF